MIIETHWGEIDVGVFGVQLWPGDMDSYVQHCREENARERRQAEEWRAAETEREEKDS